MNINRNFNDVKIFNDKKIILIGPLIKDLDLELVNQYDIILLYGFTNKHILKLNKNEIKGKIVRVVAGYDKSTFDDHIKPYDFKTDYYLLPEFHTINCYVNETNIDNKKLFTMANNYPSFGWKNGNCPMAVAKNLLFFHVNNIKPKKFYITGLNFYLRLTNDELFYSEEYWNNTLKPYYEALDKNDNMATFNKLREERRKLADLVLEFRKLEKEGKKLSILEQQNLHYNREFFNGEMTNGHSYKTDYNFFLKYISMYSTFIKLDKHLKKIIKKYNKLFEIN